ncbi:MAG: LD-carboxypeptidase [Bacteroidales bacterium]|jgi:muramoyltetrapeptide carboxypeptidase|nr:LD-carboxypeptidase [Bacteroidales bacterium]
MKKKKIQPPFLKPGDKVGIVSPSWHIDRVKLSEAIPFLENWGIKVVTGKNAARQSGLFAGSDMERLHDIQTMTDDPDIKAVIFSRGGYGLSRIIDKINFSPLKRHPKLYVGFSDITCILNWLNEVCGITSVHAEMPVNYRNADKTPETFETLRQALFGELETITWRGKVFRPGKAAGDITGGNLSLVYSLLGTPGAPEVSGRILFLEDVGEYIYHIDRMMMSLRLAGKLKGLSALVIGGMTDMNETRTPFGKSMEDIVMDAVSEYGYPVVFNFPAGHINDNRAFYFGRNAELNCTGTSNRLKFIDL